MTREQAQGRNYLKYRLLGIVLSTNNILLSKEELSVFTDIKLNLNKLIDNWDNFSKEQSNINSSARSRYKCQHCNRKFNVLRMNRGVILCKKHYDLEINVI